MGIVLPTPVQDVVRDLWERNRDLSRVVWDGEGREISRSSDEERRRLLKMIAEQTVFEMGPEYGMKHAGGAPSKDTLARLRPDGTMDAWDLFNGVTLEPNHRPESFHLTNQTFVPVAPVNHRAGGTAPRDPKDPQDPVPVPVDLTPRVVELERRLELTQKELVQLRIDLGKVWDSTIATELIQQKVIDAVVAQLEVRGSTGRSIAHSHPIKLPILRKE